MKRTSSWSAIQKTFGDHSTSTPIKKTKHNKSADKVAISADYNIEDSDEENCAERDTACARINLTSENVSATNKSLVKRQRHRSKPLSVSVTNAQPINTTIATCNDDSDDSLIACEEAHLIDVSVRRSTNYRKRSKYTANLNISMPKAAPDGPSKTNTATKSNHSEHSLINATLKDRLSTFRKTFNEPSTDLPDEIIAESDCDEDSCDAGVTPTNDRKIFFSLSVDPSQRNTQDVQIDAESTQSSLKLPSQPSPLLARPTARAKKCIKDGLVQQWQKVSSKAKSDHSFWMNDRLADLTEAGERLTVDRIEQCYGRTLLHCTNESGEQKIICLDSEHRKFSTIKVGRTIEVVFEMAGYELDDNVMFYPYVNKIFY